MRLVGSFFQRLRLGTKLTLSYTFVTVVPLLAIEVIGLFLLWALVLTTNLMPGAMARTMSEIAIQLRPYFVSSPPDADGLAQWFQSRPGLILQQDSVMWVVDADFNLLVRKPEGDEPWEPAKVSGLDRLVQAAQAGESNPDRLSSFSPQGDLVTLAPIRDRSGRIAGYLIFTAPSLAANDLYQRFVSIMGWLLIGFTVIAGSLGTFFGYRTVQSLARRLGAIARAASAWGEGDFSRAIADASSDEVGRLAQQMNKVADQLRSLLQTRQELATLEERNRLARDLHDSVKQQVFATAMQIGAARELVDRDPEAAKGHLAEAQQLIDAAREELTALIRELRPAALEGKGLAEALRQHVLHWSRRSHVIADLRVQGERSMPLNLEQEMFLVAQEALSNIARHSQATHVKIHLLYTDEAMMLTIADDGRGFELAQPGGYGLGLHSMRERMEALEGSLQVTSEPGGGTRIVAYCQKERAL